MRNTKERVFAIVLVGGKGKRLRPLSTDAMPKAFLSITRDRRTMFANTLKRIERLIPASQVMVVANKAHARLVRKDTPGIKKDRLVLEPVSRNTAPAIALAARILQENNEADVIAVLPTDHYIPDEAKQLACLKEGIEIALRGDAGFIVFGLEPKYPATGFGYIKLKGKVPGTRNAFRVDRFVEKPDLGMAKKYASSGSYLWNSGIFVFRVDRLMAAVKRHAPRIYRLLKDPGRASKDYTKMPNISIDYAIMERVKGICCIRGSYRWNDVGSFESLKKVLIVEGRRFVEKDEKIVKILP